MICIFKKVKKQNKPDEKCLDYTRNLETAVSKYNKVIIKYVDILPTLDESDSDSDSSTSFSYASSFSIDDDIQISSFDSSTVLSYLDQIQDNFYKKFKIIPYDLLNYFALKIQIFIRRTVLV
jgi:hypothetical protein